MPARQQRGSGRGADRKGERGEERERTKDKGKQSSRRRKRGLKNKIERNNKLQFDNLQTKYSKAAAAPPFLQKEDTVSADYDVKVMAFVKQLQSGEYK